MAGKYRRHQSNSARRGRKGGRGTTHNLHGGVGHHYYTAEMQRKKEYEREEQQEVTEKVRWASCYAFSISLCSC